MSEPIYAKRWSMIAASSLSSISSGLPLGLVWTAIPAYLTASGINIKTVGLFSLAQLPYALKFVVAPLLQWVGHRIPGGMRTLLVSIQWLLAAFCILAAGATNDGAEMALRLAAVSLGVALASAAQDIMLDGQAIDRIPTSHHGYAVWLRSLGYRIGMWTGGNIAVTLAAGNALLLSQLKLGQASQVELFRIGDWTAVLPFLGWTAYMQGIALLFFVFGLVSLATNLGDFSVRAPRALVREMIDPLYAFLRRPESIQLVYFVVLYKLTDSLASALVRSFLIEQGYSPADVGIMSGLLGIVTIIIGTWLGTLLTTAIGTGRALWVCGVLQAVSNLGYTALALTAPSRPLLYAAISVENICSGLGAGAFTVFLMGLTDRKFSASQYAILTSLFALTRSLSGPPAGLLVAALGWPAFFTASAIAGVPGLWALHRLLPWRSAHRWKPRPQEDDVVESTQSGEFSVAALYDRRSWLGSAIMYSGLWTACDVALDGVSALSKYWLNARQAQTTAGPASAVDAVLNAVHAVRWEIAVPRAIAAGVVLGAVAMIVRGVEIRPDPSRPQPIENWQLQWVSLKPGSGARIAISL